MAGLWTFFPDCYLFLEAHIKKSDWDRIRIIWNQYKIMWNPCRIIWNPITIAWNPYEIMWNPCKIIWNSDKIIWNQYKIIWNPSKITFKPYKIIWKPDQSLIIKNKTGDLKHSRCTGNPEKRLYSKKGWFEQFAGIRKSGKR